VHSPLQALSRLHVLAAGTENAGRPASPEAADRMTALASTLTAATEVPALLVAALTHAEVATVAPFGSYDGLVARAAERLVLVARGVDPASLVVPEAGHLALRAEYESNLRAYAEGGRSGLHAWLLYAAEAQARGAEASPLAG
jgi:Fic family protein